MELNCGTACGLKTCSLDGKPKMETGSSWTKPKLCTIKTRGNWRKVREALEIRARDCGPNRGLNEDYAYGQWIEEGGGTNHFWVSTSSFSSDCKLKLL